jgi:hypothetical protein
MQKKCSKCEVVYDNAQDFFYPVARLKSGFDSWCKKCRYDVELKNKNSDEFKEKRSIIAKKYKEKNFYEVPSDLKFQKCSTCDEIKDVTCFRRRSHYINGLAKQCKSCDYKGSKSSREAYKTKKWAYFLLKYAEGHSDKPILIDEQFLLDLYESQNGLCYWFKVKLQPSLEPKYPWQPSIDRLDRNKGYEPGNVVLACYTANIGRNVCDSKLFEKFIDDLKISLQDKTNS